MINFNEVTWYSKLLAIIFLIGVLPVLCFYIGKEYGEVKNQEKVQTIVTATPSIAATTTSVSTIDTSDWKTYRNEEYGFEFKYPESIFESIVQNPSDPDLFEAHNSSWSLVVSYSNERYDANKKDPFSPYSEKIGEVTYNNKSWSIVEAGEGGCWSKVYITGVEDKTLYADFFSCADEMLYASPKLLSDKESLEILSTFKFL
jgi:hypothetical protein